MRLRISHTTRYDYDRDVQFLPHLLYVRPREHPLLQVNSFAFAFEPEASRVAWMRDDFDNLAASAQFDANAATLKIASECTVTTADILPFHFLVRDYASTCPFAYEPLHRFNLSIYLTPPAPDERDALGRWLDQHFAHRPVETVAWLFALNQTVARVLAYQRRDEPGIQSALQTITLGTGSCRDFAVVLVGCARVLGVAARFVSGYMFDPASNGYSSGSMHAWTEVYIPGAGWNGMDPTHGLFCQNAYVPVAHAVVAESVNPVQGSFFSVNPAIARMTSDVRVHRLD